MRGTNIPNQRVFPDDIPNTAPRNTYKKEWIRMGDWLGTGTVAPTKIKCSGVMIKAKAYCYKTGYNKL